jgi:VWFA-related protein
MRSVGVRLIAPLMAVGIAMGTGPVVTQSSPQAPIFKGRLDVVRVDVTVMDNKTGRPVTGLTQRDFSVSENGVSQTIASFTAESVGGASTTPDDSANRRVFLFILGAGDRDPYKKHEGVAQFIRERLRPQDLVGVMSLGRLSPMTGDHERIAAIVDRLKRPMPLEYRELQREVKLERWARSVEEERFADNWMEPGSAETGLFRSIVPLILGSTAERQNAETTFVPWFVRANMYDSLKVVAGVAYLRAIPGDKHIVVLTPGFNPPFTFGNEGVGLFLRTTEDDKRLAAHANNAGVAIDIIQLSGMAESVMSSKNVAEYSGGQFSSLRIAAQQLARIDEGTRNGYIIGYVPSKPELDGKYRDITVTVNRKDATVVYRRGYTAAAESPPIDPRGVFTRQRLRDAAAGISDVNDIGLKVQAATVSGPGSQVRVTLNIDIKGVPLSAKPDKWEADFDLLILCGDKKRQVVCRLDQRMTLSLSQAQYDQVKLSGVPYSAVLPVTGLVTLVKVIVYHFDSDRIGVFTMNVR